MMITGGSHEREDSEEACEKAYGRGLEAPVESTLWVMLVGIQGHIGTLSPKPQFFGSPGRFFFF